MGDDVNCIPAEYKFSKFKVHGDFCKKCGKIIIDFNEKKC